MGFSQFVDVCLKMLLVDLVKPQVPSRAEGIFFLHLFLGKGSQDIGLINQAVFNPFQISGAQGANKLVYRVVKA